jgi:hypothetical protein
MMKKLQHYSKKIVTVVLIFSLFWVTASYGLAYMGKDQTAISLSGKIVDVLLGTILVYSIKSLFENIAKGIEEMIVRRSTPVIQEPTVVQETDYSDLDDDGIGGIEYEFFDSDQTP